MRHIKQYNTLAEAQEGLGVDYESKYIVQVGSQPNHEIYFDGEIPTPVVEGYLSFGSNAYIDTGIIPNINTKVVVTVSASTAIPSYSVLFGSCNSESRYNWFRVRTEETSYKLNGAVDGDRKNLPELQYPFEGVLTLDKNEIRMRYSDSTEVYTALSTRTTDIGTLLSLYIGGDHRPSTIADSKGGFILGEMKIYQNDVLVADLIPSPENGGCYYDTVSQTYKTNLGSGTITFVNK